MKRDTAHSTCHIAYSMQHAAYSTNYVHYIVYREYKLRSPARPAANQVCLPRQRCISRQQQQRRLRLCGQCRKKKKEKCCETKGKQIKKLNKRRPFSLNRIWQCGQIYLHMYTESVRSVERHAKCNKHEFQFRCPQTKRAFLQAGRAGKRKMQLSAELCCPFTSTIS